MNSYSDNFKSRISCSDLSYYPLELAVTLEISTCLDWAMMWFHWPTFWATLSIFSLTLRIISDKELLQFIIRVLLVSNIYNLFQTRLKNYLKTILKSWKKDYIKWLMGKRLSLLTWRKLINKIFKWRTALSPATKELKLEHMSIFFINQAAFTQEVSN